MRGDAEPTDAELRDAVRDSFADLQAAEARFLDAVAALDARAGSVPGVRRGREAVTFLREALRRSSAAADVAAARALTGDLPSLGKALAVGQVSRAHVDVAVRTLRQIPQHLQVDLGRVDPWFTETASALPPLQTDQAAKGLLLYLDPEGSRSFDPMAVERRELSVAVDGTGMVVLRGQLDPAAGAAFAAVLDRFSAPVPSDPVSGVADPRSKRQRQADALGVMAGLAWETHQENHQENPEHPGRVRGRGEMAKPRVVIHVRGDGSADCDQLGPLSPAWLARFACDSIVQAVKPDKLMLGRSVRTATSVQRRFLAARDGGCVIPGCPAPPGHCDAHHVDWWSRDGATDVTNLALVCGRHHSDLHSIGSWTLHMIDGVPWARPPRWHDPRRTPIRNTYHDHRDNAHQLAIDLIHPNIQEPDPDPEDP